MNDDFDNKIDDKNILKKFKIFYQCPFCGKKYDYPSTDYKRTIYCSRCLIVHDKKVKLEVIE